MSFDPSIIYHLSYHVKSLNHAKVNYHIYHEEKKKSYKNKQKQTKNATQKCEYHFFKHYSILG